MVYLVLKNTRVPTVRVDGQLLTLLIQTLHTNIQRAVYKAPANEVVNSALGFETLINKAQQEVLNPEGINCFRYFPGRGFRLWGARMMSSDSEWKYVNLRRYFAFLEDEAD